ncbi:hypothetical protein GJ744_006368 [Endocarpon pusillum]|uniref:Uncharacterized protein n=1 Tax=Endocarpon pusillum TaxID=364733 RepID=A0A8H7E5X1_9EURO|nr:hypothetical protein GJ744_006368 [Endocarpon pusillum]
MPFIWEYSKVWHNPRRQSSSIDLHRATTWTRRSDTPSSQCASPERLCGALRTSYNAFHQMPEDCVGSWDHYKVPRLFYQCSQVQTLWEVSLSDAMSMPRAPRWSDEQGSCWDRMV